MTENKYEPNKLTNANDKFFKGLMGMKEVVKAYIQQFLRKDVLDKLDLDTLELDNNSYITDELSEFFSDMVWRCHYKRGGYAKISFLHEHKSYKPKYPHFQLLDYIQGAWRLQTQSNGDPILMIPIVLYHGLAPWKQESMESYFGDLEAEFLRYLPSFDFIFINLQKYSDEQIREFDSIFLQKSLLAFKHHVDEVYLQEHIVALIFSGYPNEITDQMRSFMRMITVYLTAISGMTSVEIKGKINKSDNILKSEAMTIFDEVEQQGIEKGIEQGIEQGIEKGIEKEKQNTIIRSWENGIAASMISNITGVSIEEVEKVIANFKSKI